MPPQDDPNVIPFYPPDSPFLWTPEQHRRQARLSRQNGNRERAQHHMNLARAIENRRKKRRCPNFPAQVS